MQYQEGVIHSVAKANAGLLSTVRSMPPEKLEWQPLGCGRPAPSLLQECAQVPGLLAQVLEH